MKRLLPTFVALATLLSSAFADLSMAKYTLKLLVEQVATAKAQPAAPAAWQQCEGTLKGLETEVAGLPEAERAPFLAKIQELKPSIVAGAARNRAANLARDIRRLLESAQSDIAQGDNKLANLQDAYFGKLDQWFADEDLKSLPADELKALQATYAQLKKAAK